MKPNLIKETKYVGNIYNLVVRKLSQGYRCIDCSCSKISNCRLLKAAVPFSLVTADLYEVSEIDDEDTPDYNIVLDPPSVRID